VGHAISREGAAYPLAEVASILASADLAFVNLECPLAASGLAVQKTFSFRAAPSSVATLIAGGIDVVSLANNHTLDVGREGLEETIRVLDGAGVAHVGAGADRRLAEGPLVLKRGGITLAFLAFSDLVVEGILPRSDRTTIAFADDEALGAAVRHARGSADLVIVSLHAGVEYEPRPSERQRRLIDIAVEAGADLVLGHHPHVLQGLAFVSRPGRRPALVAYSLGNFVFDPRRAEARESAILNVTLGPGGVTAAHLVPVLLETGRTRRATGTRATAILDRLVRLSAELGTTVTPAGELVSPVYPEGETPGALVGGSASSPSGLGGQEAYP
jgi:poly-gamma-glutamate synthesis protein (capsule biosynthesis protein)